MLFVGQIQRVYADAEILVKLITQRCFDDLIKIVSILILAFKLTKNSSCLQILCHRTVLYLDKERDLIYISAFENMIVLDTKLNRVKQWH